MSRNSEIPHIYCVKSTIIIIIIIIIIICVPFVSVVIVAFLISGLRGHLSLRHCSANRVDWKDLCRDWTCNWSQ